MKALLPEMVFPGEKIVHVTGYHWIYVFKGSLPFLAIIVLGTIAWSFVPSRLTSFLIMLGFLASIAQITIKILDTMVKRCYVTNRRLINRIGWAKRDSKDVTLDRIGGIFLHQTPLERFLGYGRVKLIVPLIEIELPEYLRNPIAFRNALYMKPADKAAEKPDDEQLVAESDRQAREDDDRFGTETVSLKELQESAEEIEIDGDELGVDLGADLGADVSQEAALEADAMDTAVDDGSGGNGGGDDDI